jgi:hypothetical protein
MSQPLRLVALNGALTDDDGAARHNDPVTSYAAAAKVNARQLELDVFAYLIKVWPRDLTAFEIARGMRNDIRSISPRLRPLQRRGWVAQVGRRDCLNDKGNMSSMMTWAVDPV